MDQSQSARVFTRADVEGYFRQAFKDNDLQRYEVKQVALLPGLTPPAWIIHYEVVLGTRDEQRYRDTCVVYQEHTHGSTYLYFSVESEIPEGLTNVAEEDAAIARYKAEQRARLERMQAKRIEEEPCNHE